MECPVGYKIRKSYTRKGKKIPKSCIRSTSPYKQSSANFKKETLKRMTIRLRGFRKSLRKDNKKCSEGRILRKAYVRVITKTGKRVPVPASCIPDRGNPGKGLLSGKSGIGPLRKGELKQFGYSSVGNLTQDERHSALKKAVKEFGALSVWRKLNAIYVYTKNTNPYLSSKYDADRNWVKNTYGLKAFN